MNKTFLKIIEFLLGLIVLPRLVLLVWSFIVPSFNLSVQSALFALVALSVVLIIITFFIRKILATGFLVGTIISLILDFYSLNQNI